MICCKKARLATKNFGTDTWSMSIEKLKVCMPKRLRKFAIFFVILVLSSEELRNSKQPVITNMPYRTRKYMQQQELTLTNQGRYACHLLHFRRVVSNSFQGEKGLIGLTGDKGHQV